jgi:hypothetical protein
VRSGVGARDEVEIERAGVESVDAGEAARGASVGEGRVGRGTQTSSALRASWARRGAGTSDARWAMTALCAAGPSSAARLTSELAEPKDSDADAKRCAPMEGTGSTTYTPRRSAAIPAVAESVQQPA